MWTASTEAIGGIEKRLMMIRTVFNKTVIMIAVCFASCAMITGCGTAGDTADKLQAAKSSGETEKKPESEDKDAKKKSGNEERIDLKTEQGIRSYLEGDWSLIDRDTGRDYGTLSLQKDGSFEFTRSSDKAVGTGTLSFGYTRSEKGEEPDTFSLAFDDCKKLLPAGAEIYGDEGTGGVFHVGTFGNEDYLYMKEIGNGDSVVSMYFFNTRENYDSYGDWSYDWLFYRDNDTENPADVMEDDTFYAWAWETDEDGVWLQPMKEHLYETQEDYSNWKYMGGFFNETDNIGIAHYGITDSTDLGDLINTGDWNSGYPLMMCEVTVDNDGNVTKLRDIDIVMYDSYDMGDLEPDYTFEGTTFIINGLEIDMKEFVPDIETVVDCMRAGEWIIVECNVNSYKNVFEFYNIPNGDIGCFEYEIEGTQLKWQDDDLSTAVYVRDKGIYDFWGNMIASVGSNEEIEKIDIADDTTVRANVRVYDGMGGLTVEKRDYEYEPFDSAVLSYYECMLGGTRQLREFMKKAPKDAAALVIVNPPEMIQSRMPFPVAYENNALDRVAVVSLADSEKVYIESLDPGVSGSNSRSEVFKMKKGECKVFEVTVPEGMPMNEVVIKSPGSGDVHWEVIQLSGRIPQMSTFVK